MGNEKFPFLSKIQLTRASHEARQIMSFLCLTPFLIITVVSETINLD